MEQSKGSVNIYKHQQKEDVVFADSVSAQPICTFTGGYIMPGETVEIEAIYYTEDLGNFSVQQPLYLSGWNEPVYLSLKGKISQFSPRCAHCLPEHGAGAKRRSDLSNCGSNN